MKVAIFFDGQNFYRSLLRYDESLRVDYDRLATWITQQAGGANALFSGAYYYVGVSPDAPPLVEGFLKGLELRPGYFVKREPRVRRAGRVPAVRPPRPAVSPASSSQLERGLQELQRAEARLPHVGRGYFVMRWKSHALPPPGPEREALIQQLVDAGLAEEFETRDAEGRSVTAIRSREPDGNTREPDGNVALPE